MNAEEGNNATLGKYAGYGDWSVSSDSIDAWTGPKGDPGQKSWSNGDTCPFGKYKGKKGELVWAVDGKARTGNPSDYQQKDGETIAIGFLPKGTPLEFPPDACSAFANISDQNVGRGPEQELAVPRRGHHHDHADGVDGSTNHHPRAVTPPLGSGTANCTGACTRHGWVRGSSARRSSTGSSRRDATSTPSTTCRPAP